MKNKPNYLMVVLFIIIIGFYSIKTKMNIIENKVDEYKDFKIGKIIKSDDKILNKDQQLKQDISAFEKKFNDNFYNKKSFIENYGLINKLINSNIVDDADPDRRVIRGKSKALYYSIPKKIDFSKSADTFNNFKKYLDSKNIKFSVIIPPNKINGANSDFPEDISDYTIENTKNFEENLLKKDIKVYNLDQEFAEENDNESSIEKFYLTDSHWKANNIFWAYNKVYNILEKEVKLNNKDTLNIENYEKEEYKDTYIGSMGKRTGQKYIDKKDDIQIYFPKNNMNFNFVKYDLDGKEVLKKSGNFKETFFFKENLENQDPYAEKYISLMHWGQYYEKITNNTINNNTKVLVIRDSFALPMCAYLSQNVKEVVMIENRLSKDNTKLYEIIDKEQPDYVIFMGTTISAYYYPEMFNLDKNRLSLK